MKLESNNEYMGNLSLQCVKKTAKMQSSESLASAIKDMRNAQDEQRQIMINYYGLNMKLKRGKKTGSFRS